MEYRKEKDFQAKATYDTFDEVYTNYDVSVNDTYSADNGYPFDYPIRWLRDASMNKRIGIRRLVCTPSSHIINLNLSSPLDSSSSPVLISHRIAVTQADSLVKVLYGMRLGFSKALDDEPLAYSLWYSYNSNTNHLELSFSDMDGFAYNFCFKDPDATSDEDGNAITPNIDELLMLLNQPLTNENRLKLTNMSINKVFDEVWSRDAIFFHSSFSTSKRKYIGINGDFFTNPTVLYPPPTNESTFSIRFTSNGSKNILIRHCVFMIQLTFIVNFMKTKIL